MKESVLKNVPTAICDIEYYTEDDFVFMVWFEKPNSIKSLLGMGDTECLAWESAFNQIVIQNTI